MFRVGLAFVFACVLAFAASSAEARIVITINKASQSMSVVVDGERRWQWPVSTGRRGYATPNGSYTAFRMEEEHYSKEWDDAPMPHSIFFTKRGHAIHGTLETKRLGTAASHGCVRLHPDNAAKLYALVAERGVANATVIVTGGDSPAVARAAPRRQATPQYDEPAPVYETPSAYRRGLFEPSPRYYDPRYQDPRYEAPPPSPFPGGRGLFRW